MKHDLQTIFITAATRFLVVLAGLGSLLVGCAEHRPFVWDLTAQLEVPAGVVTPQSGPLVPVHVTVSGTEARSVNLTFEVSVGAGNNWVPMPIASASDGSVAGHHVSGVAAPFVRHTIVWDSSSVGLAAVTIARIRVTVDDGSNNGPGLDGTVVVTSFAFNVDNRDLPDLQLTLVPGTAGGATPDFTASVNLGTSLGTAAQAVSATGGAIDLTIRVVGGNLTPAAAGFNETFPLSINGASPIGSALSGTAAARGTIVLEFRATDGAGTTTIRLTLTLTDAAPVLATPVISAGTLGGSDPDYTLDVFNADALDVSFTATDPGQNVTISAEVTGGSITPAAAGLTTAFPAQVAGLSPRTLQLSGSATAAVGFVLLTITAEDPYADTDVLTLRITFNNTPPLIHTPVNAGGTLSGSDPQWLLTCVTNDSLAINVACTDTDGGPVTFTAAVTGGDLTPAQLGFSTSLPKTVIGITPVLQFAGTAAGIAGLLELTLVATDSFGAQDTVRLRITLNNSLPWFEPPPAGNEYVRQLGSSGAFNVYGNDTDVGDTLTITATVIGGTITAAQAGITVPAQSTGPSQLQYKVTGPVTALNGTVVIRFDLSDGHGIADTQTITLRINAAPVWSAPQGPTPVDDADPHWLIYIAGGEPLDWTIGATDPDGDNTLTVEVNSISGNPALAGFNPIVDVDGPDGAASVTFQFSGDWAAATTVEVNLRVHDNHGALDWVYVKFVLRNYPRINAPTIGGVNGAAPAWTTLRNIGDSLAFSITASADGPGVIDTVTLAATVTGGSLTAAQAGFVTLPSPVNGRSNQQLVFAGTCDQPGWIELTFVADDTLRGHTTATLTITINAPPLIDVPPGPGSVAGASPTYAATVGVGASLDFTIGASDADGDNIDLSMTVTGGSLNAVDAGFTSVPTVAANGPTPALVYTGTAQTAGTIDLTFLADDGRGSTHTYTLHIVIVTFHINSFTSSTGRPRYQEIVNLDWDIVGATTTLRIDPPGYDVQGLSTRIATPFGAPLPTADPRTFYVLRATTPDLSDDTIAPSTLRLLATAPSGNNDLRLFDIARHSDGSMATIIRATGVGTIDPGGASEADITGIANGEVFVSIHAPDGSVRAVRRVVGGRNDPDFHHVAFTPDGRVLIVGAYQGNAILSAGRPDEVSLTPGAQVDTYIACYSPTGDLLWHRRITSSATVRPDAIAVLADGRIAVALWCNAGMDVCVGAPGQIAVAGPTTGIALFTPQCMPLAYIRVFDGAVNGTRLRISAGPDGSLDVAAHHIDGVTIAPGQANETLLSTAASGTPFIARFGTTSGDMQWVATTSTTNYSQLAAVRHLRDGGVAICGTFHPQLTLGEGEANETTLVETGTRSLFVAAYNADGSLRWARTTDGAENSSAWSIDEQPDRSIVITALLDGSTTFGVGEANETTVSSVEYDDVVVAVFAADGTFLRAEVIADTSNTHVAHVVQTDLGGFAVAGSYYQTVRVRPDQPDEVGEATPFGCYLATFEPVNFRVLELRPGSINHASVAGGYDNDMVRGIAAALDGNTYTAGRFEGYVRVHEAPGVNQVTGFGRDDVCLIQHALDGSLVWVAAGGGSYDDEALGVDVLTNGDPVVAGYVRSLDATFGDGEANETHITNPAEGDNSMFVARYDADTGELVWLRTTSGTGRTRAQSVCALGDGRLVVGGHVFKGGTAVFGEGEANQTSINATNYDCLFLACYRADGDLEWARAVNSVGTVGSVDRLVQTDDRVVAVGIYEGSAVFGPLEQGQTPLGDNGHKQVWLAALDIESGLLQWTRRMAANDDGAASGLAVTPDGRIVCSGDANASVTLALGHASQIVVPQADPSEGWIAWFSSAGVLLQAQVATLALRDLTVLPDGTIAGCGTLGASPVVFGQGEADEITLTPTGNSTDGWIALWRADGSFHSASQFGGDFTQTLDRLCARPDGSIGVGGTLNGDGLAGYGEPGEISLDAEFGGFDLAVMRYHPMK